MLSSFIVALIVVFMHVLIRSLATGEEWVTWTPGEAHISMLMVGGLGLWLICHAGTALYIKGMYRRRQIKDPFWAGGTNKALWLGPLHRKAYQKGGEEEAQQCKRLQARIENVLVKYLRQLNSEIRHPQAKKADRQWATDRNPLPEEVLVKIWDAKDANAHLKRYRELYTFGEPFAVVVFATEEAAVRVAEKRKDGKDARHLLAESGLVQDRGGGRGPERYASVELYASVVAEPGERRAIFSKTCKLEPLNPAWFALTQFNRRHDRDGPPWSSKKYNNIRSNLNRRFSLPRASHTERMGASSTDAGSATTAQAGGSALAPLVSGKV